MPADQPARVQLCLISHTNAGKTTLARTLLGADVGEVRDAAHVTETSDSHKLVSTPEGDELLLWDTPGFGDSVRLAKRLAMSGNPMGWFLSEVWDRLRDRPFWLSQRALLTARDHADVILYLVNAAEDPQDAGYLAPEMQILKWLNKPVVVLLNQMGPPSPANHERQEQARWRAYFDSTGFSCAVVPMDAFARCWVHENKLFDAIARVIHPGRKAAYDRLAAAWQTRSQERFSQSMATLAEQITADALDTESAQAGSGQLTQRLRALTGNAREDEEQAMRAIETRAAERAQRSTEALLALHGLSGAIAAALHERLAERYTIKSPLGVKRAGVLGALLSGAATGAYADLMAGGLTLGGGMVAGALAGAAGFAGAAWSLNKAKGSEATIVRLSQAALVDTTTTALLRYLAVAHFGRGRGDYVQGETPAFWQEEVTQRLSARQEELGAILTGLRTTNEPTLAQRRLAALLQDVMTQILAGLYPSAR